MTRRRVGGLRPTGRLARSLLLALVALLVYSVVGQAAEASPARPASPAVAERADQVDPPPNGTCEDIARHVFRPPPTIRHREIADPSPADYGDALPIEGLEPDPRFTTTYCWNSATNPPTWDGEWALRTDSFPYDSPNECVYARTGEDGPASIPLEDIEDLWAFTGEPDGDAYRRYCRDGTTWTAAADVPPAAGECETVTRFTYKPKERLDADEDPDDVGNPNSIMPDPRFDTTYCAEGGRWVMTEDGFPYDSPDECIGIYYDDNEHERRPPPAQIPPDMVDQYGQVDSQSGLLGTSTADGILEEYCRDGSAWARSARQDDMPAGDWSEWSEECKTIYPMGTGDDLPRRTGRDPFELGENTRDPDFPIGTVQASKMVTYCRQGDDWYRVDDYPLDEQLTEEQRERLNHPPNGTCVVMDETPPEVLPRLSGPHEWGTYLPLDLWREQNEGQPEDDKLLCFVAGAWRRGDNLDNVCATNENLGPEDRADDLGSVWLIPDACWGRYPTTQYDLNYDSGGLLDYERKLTGWWTALFFDLGKGATQITLWSVGWAYDFNIRDYNDLGITLGDDYQEHLLDNDAFKLLELAWFALIAWAGFTALRGKISMAGGEIAMSTLLVALSFVLMQNRATYMEAVWHLMDEASAELLVAGMGDQRPPGDDDNGTDSCVEVGTAPGGGAETEQRVAAAVADMQRQIHCVFVEQPYDYLNWGRPLTGECAAKRNQILARGPHGNEDTPRQMMDDGACSRLVDYNEKPTGTRLLGSAITLGASATMAFFMVSLSLTVVVSKLVALFLFALAPFVAIVAVAPAGGRRLAWLWVSTLFQVTGAVIGSGLLLSGLLLGLKRLFMATTDVALIERFFVMLLLILVIAMARRRMLAGGQASAGRFADNMTNFRLGGGAPWQGASGSKGVNLLNIDRGLEGARARAGRAAYMGAFGAASAASFPFVMGGRSYAQRARERRQTRRSFKNLMNVEFAKRALQRPQYTETWKLVKKGAGAGGSGGGGTGGAIATIAAGGPAGPAGLAAGAAALRAAPTAAAARGGATAAGRTGTARGAARAPTPPAVGRARVPGAQPPLALGTGGPQGGGRPSGPRPASPAPGSQQMNRRTVISGGLGGPQAPPALGPGARGTGGARPGPAAPDGGARRGGPPPVPPASQDMNRREFLTGGGRSSGDPAGPGRARAAEGQRRTPPGPPPGSEQMQRRDLFGMGDGGSRPSTPSAPPPRPAPPPPSAPPRGGAATPPFGTPSASPPGPPAGGGSPPPGPPPAGGAPPSGGQPPSGTTYRSAAADGHTPARHLLGDAPAPNDGRVTPPYQAPDGYEWERDYEIFTTGDVPDTVGHPLRGRTLDPDRDGVLPPSGPIDRLAQRLSQRRYDRGTREEMRRREEWQRILDWAPERPGRWPDP